MKKNPLPHKNHPDVISTVGKFDVYQIDLKGLPLGTHSYEYTLDNKFFADIDGTDVQKGNLKVWLTVQRAPEMFEMDFRIEGVVWTPCDKCLDDVELPVESKNRLVVKFGKEYAEESDEIVVVPESEGAINVAWFLYEFVVLAIPMKHIHPPGKCNKAMQSTLRRHAAKKSADDREDENYESDEGEASSMENETMDERNDPRWDALKDWK